MNYKLLLSLFAFISCTALHAQEYWNTTPRVESNGEMEIGKYVDFHESSNDPNSYSLRLYSHNRVLNSSNSMNINGNLKANTMLVDKSNRISDWNNIWQSGFFESINGANVPEGGWSWGINFNHSSNNADYRYNGQLVIKNNSTSPTMYFRSTGRDGTGIWTKVLHSRGTQHISGALGIGTTSLGTHKLAVEGSIRARELEIGNSMLIEKSNRISDWNNIWQSGFFESINGANVPEGGWFWGINFNHGNNSADYRYNGQLIIKNQSTSPTMYFRSTTIDGTGTWTKVLHSRGTQKIDGALGVGTVNTEGYTLSVGGKIRAEEVKVYTGWSDFVFADDYVLPPLSEVEQHIKQHKHLPAIPSEAEVLENGIELGVMNAKLLQKIEELTLYVIEQEKKMGSQEKKLHERDVLIMELLTRLKAIETKLEE